jgi:DNA-binding response OmpR family regulator
LGASDLKTTAFLTADLNAPIDRKSYKTPIFFKDYSKRFQIVVMSRQEKEVNESSPFRIDVSVRRLSRQGRNLPLTPKVFDTLLVLVENRGTYWRKTS